MENCLLSFIGKVGTGARGAKDLTYEEAFAAMNAILDGAYHPVTLGAFLLAERWKPETAEEMAAFADAMQQRLIRLPSFQPIPGLINYACAYDGKKRTLNIGIPAALIASAAGVPILLHSGCDVPTKAGATHFHVLNRLGIDARPTQRQAYDLLRQIGIAYLHQPDFNPEIHKLLDERRQVGKRTIFNTIEPWANPFAATIYVGGFFHRPFAELICNAMQKSSLGYERIIAVAGIEGSNEIRPERSLIAEIKNGAVETTYLESSAFGLHIHSKDIDSKSNIVNELSCESAERIEALLKGGEPGGFCDIILLNAAFLLLISGKIPTLREGITRSREILKTREAWEKLRQWRCK
jgi:anthranilate phosphoribosyltransferase